jgi:hypothetical protein
MLAAHLNEPARALSFLERYLGAIGGFQVNLVEADPDLDPLRGDPRFDAMLMRARKRLGIAERAAAN